MINRSVRGTIKCPICRTTSHTKEMSYILARPLTTPSQRSEENCSIMELVVKDKSKYPVSGSYGTKLEAVVRLLRYIQDVHPGI